MSDIGIQAGQKNVFGKEIDKNTKNGCFIGTAIGAGVSGLCIIPAKPMSEDSFIKQCGNLAKDLGGKVNDSAKDIWKSQYSDYLDVVKASFSISAKASKIVKSAAICGVIGAGIGFIAKKIKESKAQKADI